MTIKEISKLAGVSIGTVDRVIHNRGKVSEENRKKIQEIIDTYAFKPNVFASNLKLNTKHTVGVLLPLISSSERGYWDLIYRGILKAAKELHNQMFRVKIFEFSRDIQGSFTKVANEMMQKYNITSAIISPVCLDETRVFLDNNPELKYIYVDTPLSGTEPICIIAQDPFQSGVLGGRVLSLLSDSLNRFVAVRTYNSYNSLERTRGFKEYFKDKQAIDIQDILIEDSTDMDSFIFKLYRDFGTIDGIFVSCSAVTSVIGDSLSKLGKKETTSLLGYDLINKNCLGLMEGKIDCIFSQQPQFQGYNALYSMYRKLVLKQHPKLNIDIKVDIVFKENIYEEDFPIFEDFSILESR